VLRLFVSYRAWPDISSIDPKWEKIRDVLFHLLLQKKVVYTPAHLGQWLTVQKAVFDLLSKDEPKELLQQVLLAADVPVVSVPSHVTDAISCYAGVKNITPSGTRAILKQVPSCYQNLDRREKLLLLQFCLKDRKYDKLCGLMLLPLFNGTFTKFSDQGERIYVCSRNHPRQLFPGLGHRFLDEKLDGDVIGKLNDAADQGRMIPIWIRLWCYLTEHFLFLILISTVVNGIPFISRMAQRKEKRPYNELTYQNCNKDD